MLGLIMSALCFADPQFVSLEAGETAPCFRVWSSQMHGKSFGRIAAQDLVGRNPKTISFH